MVDTFARTGMDPEWTAKGWRRRPDLNRGWRFCRPLPYHLATAPLGCAYAVGLRPQTKADLSRSPDRTSTRPRTPDLAAERAHRPRVSPSNWCGSEEWSGKRASNPR